MHGRRILVSPLSAPKGRRGAVPGRSHTNPESALTLRLDADVLAWFKAHGGERGYQTRINRALREYVAADAREGEPG